MADPSTGWTFLTSHAAVLLCIHRRTVRDGQPVTVREIADHIGVTERTVHHVLKDLEAGGYISRRRVGNRTHYEIHEGLPLRRPSDSDLAVGMLLDSLAPVDSGGIANARRPHHDPPLLGDQPGLVAADGVTADGVERALRVMRVHLGLDVAFVSRVRDGQRVFTHVDSATDPAPIKVGDSDPVEDSYCHHVIHGRIPQLLVDPAAHPVASRLRVTKALPVGTHLSVPLELSDGSVYGTCCTFGYGVRDHVDERDLAAVRMLARLVAAHLDPSLVPRPQRPPSHTGPQR